MQLYGKTRLGFAQMCKMEHIDHLTLFTFGTRAVPGFSQCGTAVGLQCSPIDVDLTAIIDDLKPAGALSSLCVMKQALWFLDIR